ncbi:unnamed protein product, partial [Cyprideis torosa]
MDFDNFILLWITFIYVATTWTYINGVCWTDPADTCNASPFRGSVTQSGGPIDLVDLWEPRPRVATSQLTVAFYPTLQSGDPIVLVRRCPCALLSECSTPIAPHVCGATYAYSASGPPYPKGTTVTITCTGGTLTAECLGEPYGWYPKGYLYNVCQGCTTAPCPAPPPEMPCAQVNVALKSSYDHGEQVEYITFVTEQTFFGATCVDATWMVDYTIPSPDECPTTTEEPTTTTEEPTTMPTTEKATTIETETTQGTGFRKFSETAGQTPKKAFVLKEFTSTSSVGICSTRCLMT